MFHVKHIRHIFEYIAFLSFYTLFRLLPLDSASALGGWLGRTVGPRLAASRKALRNIAQALPELSSAAQKQILIEMWDNLGRVLAEYPHLKQIAAERVEIEHKEVFEALCASGETAIFAGAHIGNWEIGTVTFNMHFAPLDATYRAPNNPYIDRLLRKARKLDLDYAFHTKSRVGGRTLMAALKSGRHAGIMIDQKYNEGIPVPFFGREAMTNPVAASLALRYNCLLMPFRVRRTHGAHFVMTACKALPLRDENNAPRPLAEIMADLHSLFESWIRDKPGQWLWLHRRWDSKALNEKKEKHEPV